GRVNWLSMAAVNAPFQASIQIRYRTAPVAATLFPLEDGRLRAVFDEPQFGVTPGQAAVWYSDDLVLGGGLIEAATSASPDQRVLPEIARDRSS
ncbi:hypothetical protein C7271_08765, partial [filamentous cyanobacterium CCP5]